jgi:hypothetical protein
VDGGGIAELLTVDLALSGFGAYQHYRRERQNDLASAASVFGQGIALTNRPSNYGSATTCRFFGRSAAHLAGRRCRGSPPT